MTVTKGKKHRTFSQSTLRKLTSPKPAPNPEDIFKDIETPEERAARKRLEQRAIKEAKLRAEALNHEFIVGKKYVIYGESRDKALTDKEEPFIYQCKQGKHHVFRHAYGGWSRTYTDQQLIGKIIKEF